MDFYEILCRRLLNNIINMFRLLTTYFYVNYHIPLTSDKFRSISQRKKTYYYNL